MLTAGAMWSIWSDRMRAAPRAAKPVTLAFYKGRASDPWHRAQDAAIRLATRGTYSHVELIPGSITLGDTATCLSASGRDGGVRSKRILLKPTSWDLVPLDIAHKPAAQFILARIGARYDYKGILLSQLVALGRHSETRWFCSEIVAAALGIKNPHRVSPQMLFDIVLWHRGMR